MRIVNVIALQNMSCLKFCTKTTNKRHRGFQCPWELFEAHYTYYLIAGIPGVRQGRQRVRVQLGAQVRHVQVSGPVGSTFIP